MAELTAFEGDLEPDEDYEGVRFADTTFDETAAGGCHFLDCSFTKVTCTEVDLRGAQLGITAGYESLRGVTIDSVQLVALAPYLARHLGIIVDG